VKRLLATLAACAFFGLTLTATSKAPVATSTSDAAASAVAPAPSTVVPDSSAWTRTTIARPKGKISVAIPPGAKLSDDLVELAGGGKVGFTEHDHPVESWIAVNEKFFNDPSYEVKRWILREEDAFVVEQVHGDGGTTFNGMACRYLSHRTVCAMLAIKAPDATRALQVVAMGRSMKEAP
jgi:hypothetical protein